MIYLLYQSPWPIGGSTSYTVHLAKVLHQHGEGCRVLRIGKRTEEFKRPIGAYGVDYQIVSIDTIMAIKDAPILLVASSPKHDEEHWARLAKKKNFWCVFHDPNEFALYPHWKHVDKKRVICIRETGLDHIPHGEFIPHPYMPHDPGIVISRPHQFAISLARTSSVKHSDWILEANRALPKDIQVELYGELNRLWAFSYLSKHYPEFKAPGKYPRRFGAGVELCGSATLMVDLTIFKNDGGGTQYTFLEAMDGGAVPVMTKDWCSYKGPARNFGLTVGSPEDLVKVLLWARKHPNAIALLRKRNYKYLRSVHNPLTISSQYQYTLGV